jgi:hypothetical protein
MTPPLWSPAPTVDNPREPQVCQRALRAPRGFQGKREELRPKFIFLGMNNAGRLTFWSNRTASMASPDLENTQVL